MNETHEVCTSYPRVNAILSDHADLLAADAAGYRNHVYRTINYYSKLSGAKLPGTETVPETVLIAAAFHDIGIWTANTFDYLAPSISEARAYLGAHRLEHLEPQIHALIDNHHKVRSYEASFAELVETFRRADLVDLSLGAIRFGLTRAFVSAVRSTFPDAGFHQRLVQLTLRELLRKPWRPLPMLRW